MARSSDGSPDDPLRVLFIDHTARWGGGEVALFNLIEQLDRRRVSPAVVLLEDGELKQSRALDPVEQAAWTASCLALLNLDETLTKE